MSSQGLGLIETGNNVMFVSTQWTSNIESANDNTPQIDTLGSYANYKFKNGLLLPFDNSSNSQNLLNYGGQYVLDDNRDCLYLQSSNYALIPNNNWTEYQNLTISGWFKGIGLQNGDEILNFGGDKFFYDTSNLVAWYRFDGNSTNMLLDSSGKGNTLTNYNATFDSGIMWWGKYINGSVYMNGSSQYLEFPTSINPFSICNSGNGGITFSFWFNTSTSSGSWARIFDMGDTSNPSNNILVAARIGTQTNMRFSIKVGGTEIPYDTTANWADNIWHHGVWCISDTGRWSIYIDNVNLGVNISRTIPNITWALRYIGRSTYPSDGWFVGNINDFRIYNRIISSDEVNRLYKNQSYYNDKVLFQNDTTNLLAWYKFDGNSLDSSGRGYNITSTVGTVTYSNTDFIIGTHSALFNGSSYFNLPAFYINFVNGISISFWIKMNSSSIAWANIWEFSDGTNFFNFYRQNTNARYVFQSGISGSSTWLNIHFDNNQAYVWNHVVWCISSIGKWNIYINAELIHVGAGYYPAANDCFPIPSGNYGTRRIGTQLNGNIDDYRFYNKVLSHDEVKSLSYASPYYNTIYKFYNQTNDMICWYKFDQDSTNMLLDSSGNANNLTNYSCLFNSADYKTWNGSVQFTGSSLMDRPNDGRFSPDNFTISVWCKIVQPAVNTYVAIASCRNITTNEFGWIIYIINNRLEFWTGPGTGGLATWNGFNQILYSNFATSPPIWTHLAITMNKSTSTAIVYINGISVGTFTRNYANNTATNIRIGAGANDSTAHHYLPNGSLLDDFRMYNRVLTANEINMLYTNRNTLYNSTYSLAIRERNEYLSFQINDVAVYETSNIFNNTWNHFVWNVVDSTSNLGYVRINNGVKNFYNQLVLSQPVLSVFPPAAMTANNTMIDGITYRACAYDWFDNNFPAYLAFTKNATGDNGWASCPHFSTANKGLIISGYSFGNDINFKGVYLGIDMGQQIVVQSYKIMRQSAANADRLPNTWKIYATNDTRCWNETGGKNRTACFNLSPDYGWVQIDYQLNQTTYADNTLFNIPNNFSGYRFYAINISSVRNNADLTQIGDWYIYGYPYFTYNNRLGAPTNQGTVLLNDFRLHTNTITNIPFDDIAYDKYSLINYGSMYSMTSNENRIISLSKEEYSINSVTNNYSAFSNLSISTWIKTENFANNDTILEISNSFLNDTTNLYFWYKFDQGQFLKNFGIAGGAYDLIGSAGNTIICQSTDYITGTASANFTATSGYLYTPQYNFATYFSNAATFSFWVRRKGLNTFGDTCIYGWLNMAPDQSIIIQRNTTNAFWSIYLFGSQTNTNGVLNDYTNDNVWNHYVWVAEKSGTATKITCYKNGIFVYTNTSGTWSSPNVGFIFSGTGGGALIGNLDDFRIYNRALTADEIRLLASSPYYKYYNDPRNLINFYENINGLIALYKFDDNVTNMLLDSSSSGYHLTNSGATFDSSITRRGNGSIAFSTINTYAIMPATLNPYTIWNTGTGISFSIWFRGSSSSGAGSRLFDFADNPNGTTIPTNCIAALFKNGSINFYLFIKVNSINYEYIDSTDYLDNNWHHLVWTISSTGVWTVYIDNVNKNAVIQVAGVSTNTVPRMTIPNSTWTRRFIGRSVIDWDNAFVGNMDDFRIYNRVLSNDEVTALYMMTYNQNPVAWYRFDKDANSMLLDSSSNGYTLINYGGTFSSINYKLGYGSVYLNGSSYLEMPIAIDPYNIWNGKGITFSIWFNIPPSSMASSRIFDFSDGTIGGTNTNSIFIARNAANNTLTFAIYTSTNPVSWVTSTSYINSAWHHIIWSISASGVWTIYIDNVLQVLSGAGATGTVTLGTLPKTIPNGVTWTKRWIGREGGTVIPVIYTTGNFDDFRIYNRVLSAAEVNILYNLQTTNGIVLKRSNNLLSFQVNEIPVYETPYIDNKWNHILWNVANTSSSQGFVKINNGTKNFFDIIPINFNKGQNFVKYPPIALSISDVNDNTRSSIVSGQPYGNGIYYINWSSDYGSWRPSQWFNGVNSSLAGGHFAMNTYSSTTGLYTYLPQRFLVSNYPGEWLTITFPNSIYLSYVKIYQRSGHELRSPKDFRIYGSNDGGITWTLLIDVINATYTSLIYTSISINTVISYNTFGFVVGSIFANNNHADKNVNFDELEFYECCDNITTKLSSVSNSGDLYLYNYNMVTTALTTQMENDFFNTVIPPDYSEYVAYNNIRIYPDRIRVKNKDYITSNYYLDYDFKPSRLALDNTSNIRGLNIIGGAAYLKDYNRNTLLLRSGQEAQFPNENWMNYSDLTISGWFKSDRPQNGDDIIVEMTTNTTGNTTNLGVLPKNNFFNDITNLYFWYKFDSIDFLKNYGLAGKDYDLQPSSGSTIYPQKTDKVFGDASANFTASAGFLVIPQYNFANTFSSAITISFWLRRKGLNTAWDVVVYGYLNGGMNSTFIIQRNQNDATKHWAINIFGAETNTNGVLNDYTNDNVWNHYVWVAEKSGITTKLTCYKNGVFIYTTTNGTWSAPNIGFSLSYNASSATMIGNLDDFRIYNKALSQDEINILYYNSGFYTQTANLIAWYKFDGDGTQMLADSSGNNNMLVSSSTTNILFDGSIKRYGTCSLQILNGSAYLSNGNINLSSKSFSVAFWMRFSNMFNNSVGDYTIVSQGTSGTTRALLQILWRNNLMIFSFFADDLSSPTYDYTNVNNIWVHWTFTYNVSNNSRIIYKDGIAVASGTSGGSLSASSSSWRIGTVSGNVNTFIGNIDDVRIYDRPITESEVRILYNQNSDTPYNYLVRRRDNILSFQINNTPIYETPYTNDLWTHFLWNINNSLSTQGYIKLNNGVKRYFNKVFPNSNNIYRYPRYNMTSDNFSYPDNSGLLIRTTGSTKYIAAGDAQNSYFQAFTPTSTDFGWASAMYCYNSTTGVALNTYRTGYAGEYLQIDLVEQVVINQYILTPRTDTYNTRNPVSYRIYASNDFNVWTNINHTSWILIEEKTDIATYSSPITYYLPNNRTAYRFYVMIINKTNASNGQGMVQVRQLHFFGYPVYSPLYNTYLNKLGSANNQGSLYLSDFTIFTNKLTQAMETQLYTQAPEFKNLSSTEYLKNELRNINALYWNGSKKIEGNWNGANVLGTMTVSGGVTSFFSDMRLKDVVCNIEYPLEKIKRIDTFKYTPNDLAKSLEIFPNKLEVGVSAQSVKEVLPEVVELAPFDTSNIDNNIIVSKSGENYLSVSYENMVPLLIESVKDLNKKFNSIKNI